MGEINNCELKNTLVRISSKILSLSNNDFNYCMVDEDSSLLWVRRRLTRMGISENMFKDKADYYAWRNELIANRIRQNKAQPKEKKQICAPIPSKNEPLSIQNRTENNIGVESQSQPLLTFFNPSEEKKSSGDTFNSQLTRG